jgi:hypothetical protein
MAVGIAIYVGYGRRHSVLANRQADPDVSEDVSPDLAAP